MATYTSNYAWTKPSGSDPVDISVLNGNLDSQDGIIHDAFLNMAVPFSELLTYTVGNIVLYGTKTYKCRVPVTTPGSWTGATNWDEHKLSELTLDNTPTNGSNNPVKSDGIYDSEKDIYAVMGQMGAKNLIPYPYYDNVGNIQPATGTNNGITWVINDDNSVTFTGEATEDFVFYMAVRSSALSRIPLKAGKYKLIGCPAGGSTTTYDMYLNAYRAGTSTTITGMRDTGEGIEREYDVDIVAGMYIEIKSGYAIQSSLTFKPMLRLASDTDGTYQPYAKTNKQLTDEIANKVDKVESKGLSTNDYDNTEKAEVAKVAGKAEKTTTATGETLSLVPTSEGRALLHTAYGMSTQNGTPTPSSPVDIVSSKADFRSVGKNLIPYPYGFIPANIFSIENDGTVVMNGSTSNRINCWLVDHTGGDYWLPSGTYKIIVSEAPDNVKWTVGVNYYMNNTWVSAVSVATGKKSVNFTVDTSSSAYNIVSLCVTAFANSSFSNFKIKVMVVKDSVNDDTYEPYTKHDTTTDLTLRAIEVTSSDAYNLVRDGKYYIADTLDYSEDNGWTVTRRIGHVASYDGETITTKWMSSKDVYASGTNPSSGATVDYILATPTTEAITTAQALALLGLKTYDESTTISSQAEPSCTIAVEYAKERLGALALTAYNTAKGNDLRITALEEA